MKIRLCVLLSVGMLTGCVAAMVAGATAGMIVYDKRGVNVIESDTRIFYLARRAVVSDPRLEGSHIEVASFNKMVLLVGQVPSPSARVAAEKIVQGIPNVRRVYNELTVGRPIPIQDRPRDVLITGQIRSMMLTKKGLESGSIRVVTENQVVYLMGLATHEQANLAASVARQTRGVQKVVKVFQYTTLTHDN